MYAQDNILCQFGLFRHKFNTVSPPILNHFWWELYQTPIASTVPANETTSGHGCGLQNTRSNNQCGNQLGHGNGKMEIKTPVTVTWMEPPDHH